MNYKKEIIDLIEHLENKGEFCVIFTLSYRTFTMIYGGNAMSYKEKIIALLDKVNDEYILKRVYKLLIYLYLKEE